MTRLLNLIQAAVIVCGVVVMAVIIGTMFWAAVVIMPFGL